jgi:hypothetical protein
MTTAAAGKFNYIFLGAVFGSFAFGFYFFYVRNGSVDLLILRSW